MKKFNALSGSVLLCALALNASPNKNDALAHYYSGKLLGEIRVKEGLIKAGRCPELCAFISNPKMAIIESELY